ncbi:CD0519/CD1768 family membrane protein [Acidaminobacterium chupaoyuni]
MNTEQFTIREEAKIAPKAAPTAKSLIKWAEPVCFVAILLLVNYVFASQMGLANMLNTMMNTAYQLLLKTAFYIMAIAVIMSAFSALLTEFGVTDMVNKILSPLMRPLYGLPGASALGVVTTYLSDNPAILALADDKGFRKYFKKYQMPALTNIGTAFGMGLIVTTFMIGLSSTAGVDLGKAALIGNLGAIVGSIVSTRLMLRYTKKLFGAEIAADPAPEISPEEAEKKTEEHKKLGERVLTATLEGGKTGVELGLAIVPGVVIICTLVLMLTSGMPAGGYTGAADQGIGLLPYLAGKIDFLLKPLFGFTSSGCIAVPITALGSAGAAIGLVPSLLKGGAANPHDIAVFTAMCMCWSGYLSTHVSMMDALGFPKLSGKAIACHTVGGIVAGVAANWLFVLFSML